MYALMGTGAHGHNGVNPVVSRKIWERYNIPRSTHGLDVQIFPESELKRLLQHETQFLKGRFGANIHIVNNKDFAFLN